MKMNTSTEMITKGSKNIEEDSSIVNEKKRRGRRKIEDE